MSLQTLKIDEMELVIVNVLLQLMIVHTLVTLPLCRESLKVLLCLNDHI